MKTFIKAVQVWVPADDSMSLRCIGSSEIYLRADTDAKDSTAAGEPTTLRYGSGLPGQCWQRQAPLLTDRKSNRELYIETGLEARGVDAALAMPILAGDFLVAVMVFMFSDQDSEAGAVEHWHCATRDSYDLKLAAGFYGQLEHFEFISRHTSFRKGIGLPGTVWAERSPMLLENLAESRIFVRSQGAAEAGVSSGFALPCAWSAEDVHILAFLSSAAVPIAQQVEIWAGEGGAAFEFADGFSCIGLPLKQFYRGHRIVPGEGMLGRVLLTGRPEVSEQPEDFYFSESASDRDQTLNCKLVFPLMFDGRCTALVVMYL